MKVMKTNETVFDQQTKRFQKGLNRERIEQLARETMAFLEKRMRDGGLRSVIDDVVDLVGIIGDGVTGRFPVPWTEILKIAGALGYLLCPVDLTPDAIPFIGLLDDVAVIAYAARCLAETISAYRAWRGGGC